MFYIRLIQTCSIASTVPGAGTRSRRGYPQPARLPAAGAGTRRRRGYPQTARVPAATMRHPCNIKASNLLHHFRV